MENNGLIKYQGGLTKHVGNAISVTNKLLALGKRQKIIDFFISNPDLFRKLISLFYPINVLHLKQYQNFWDWSFKGISFNKNINWNEEIIDEFKNKISWPTFTNINGILWTPELIEKYKDSNFEKASWSNLSCNRNLLFSEELVDKYFDNWNWGYLSSNRAIFWNSHLIEKYKSKLNWNELSENTSIQWSEILIDKYIEFWNWHLLASNNSIDWNDKRFWGKYVKNICYNDLARNVLFNWSTDFIQEFDLESWDWEELCYWLPIWNELSIEKFLPYLDFTSMSYNENIRWPETVIDKYFTKWDWQQLSRNSSLPFTMQFIEKYSNVWNWDSLTTSQGLPWSIELIDNYKGKWNWKNLGHESNLVFPNEQFWIKAFQPYINDAMVEEIMRKISP